MAITGLHTSWDYGSYAADILYQLEISENRALIIDHDENQLSPHSDDGGSIAIGYGFDVLKNSDADIEYYIGLVNGAPLTLTANDKKLLSQARVLHQLWHDTNKLNEQGVNDYFK